MKDEWTSHDAEQARAHGWCLATVIEPSGKPTLQVLPTEIKGQSVPITRKVVIESARGGNKLAIKALRLSMRPTPTPPTKKTRP